MLKKIGEASTSRNMTLVEALQARREYRNPYFVRKMMDGISEYGTCFSAHVWDPAMLPPEDFYDTYAPLPQQLTCRAIA
jgi:HCNGP-like protein